MEDYKNVADFYCVVKNVPRYTFRFFPGRIFFFSALLEAADNSQYNGHRRDFVDSKGSL